MKLFNLIYCCRGRMRDSVLGRSGSNLIQDQSPSLSDIFPIVESFIISYSYLWTSCLPGCSRWSISIVITGFQCILDTLVLMELREFWGVIPRKSFIGLGTCGINILTNHISYRIISTFNSPFELAYPKSNL